MELYIEAGERFFNFKDFVIVNTEDIDFSKIYAVDFKIANDYVLGNSDIEPQLIEFDPQKHLAQWKEHSLVAQGFSHYEIKSVGGCVYTPDSNFQLITRP